MTDSILSASQGAPKYGIPASDPGAAFASNLSQTPDTSRIFYGSSRDKATAWRVDRSPGSIPNAAYAGKGAITFDDNSSAPPFEVK